jgi:hypothetical protein
MRDWLKRLFIRCFFRDPSIYLEPEKSYSIIVQKPIPECVIDLEPKDGKPEDVTVFLVRSVRPGEIGKVIRKSK